MKFSVRFKLVSSFFLVLILMGIVTSIGYGQLRSAQTTYEFLINDRAHKVIVLEEMIATVKQQQSSARGYLLLGDDKLLQESLRAKNHYLELSKQLALTVKSEKGKQLLSELNQIQADYSRIVDDIVLLRKANKLEEMRQQVATRCEPTAERFTHKAEEFRLYQIDLLTQSQKETASILEKSKFSIIAFSLAALIVGIGLSLLVSHVISTPVRKISSALSQVAEGNLQVPSLQIKNHDEIGLLSQSFHTMIHNLQHMITEVQEASIQVASFSQELTASAEQTSQATNQIAETMQGVAAGSEQQVHHVKNSSSFIADMSEHFQQIAEQALNVSDTANTSFEAARNGNETIQQTIVQMEKVNESVQTLADIVGKLGSSSERIGQIVEVIKNIADQTNLLALNAAIEAARAGEQGRGFAVVADEVRKLAEQSSASSSQIAELITNIQAEALEAVQSMKASEEEIHKGTHLVEAAAETFIKIRNHSSEASHQIIEVSETAKMLYERSKQVVSVIEEIQQIAQESAAATQTASAATEEQLASMEEITATSSALTQMADRLQQQVGKFVL